MAQESFPSVEEFLNPISEANPVGPSLRWDSEYDELEEARRADDDASSQGDWRRSGKVSDWLKVIDLGENLLRERTKDLMIAAWVVEAQAHVRGLPGLRYGLNLLRELQTRFWENIHPAEDGLDARQGIYEFLDQDRILPILIQGIPLTFVAGSPEMCLSSLKYKESRETENLLRKPPPPDMDHEQLVAGRLTGQDFDKAMDATDRQYLVDLIEDVRLCTVEVEQLNKDLKERWKARPQAPTLSRVPVALKDLDKLARQFLAKKPAAQEPPKTSDELDETADQEDDDGVYEEPEASTATTDEEGWSTPAPQPVRKKKPKAAAAGEPITTVEQAHEAIAQAAHFLRNAAPSDPTSYLVLRGMGLGAVYQAGGDLESASFPCPSSELRQRLHGLERSDEEDHWSQLLNEAETAMGQPEGRGWIDLQRYALAALAELGYEQAARACRSILGAGLRDHENWPQVLLNDGTPCASEASRAWIRSEKLGGSGDVSLQLNRLREAYSPPASEDGDSNNTGAPAAVAREADPWDEAQTLSQAGNTAEAIAVMARAARQARTGRDRFLRTLQQAELCLALQRVGLALPLLEGLAQRVDEFHLDQWEDTVLCARVFSALYRCLKGHDEARARTIYNRLCQLDVSMALELGAE